VTQTDVMEERWNSKLDDTALSASVTQPRALPSSDLRSGIEYRKAQRPGGQRVRGELLGPLVLSAQRARLVLAAVPFAFGSLRSGGLGKRLFIGIVFALGFWLLQTQFVKLAGVYKFDYRIAYLIPRR
jgi:lipopolysaccharide export system permease protein